MRTTALGVGALAPRPAPPGLGGKTSGLELAPEPPLPAPEDEMSADLPLASSLPPEAFEEIDLPAQVGTMPEDLAELEGLPALSPRQGPPADDSFEADFEFGSKLGEGSAEGESIDLPEPKAENTFQEIDLPSVPPPKADQRQALGELDLPAPADEVPELPAPVPRGAPIGWDDDALDLSGDLPVVSGDLPDLTADLPGLGDLPVPSGDLPDVSAALPASGGELPDLEAQLPLVGGGLPEGPVAPPELHQAIAPPPERDDSFATEPEGFAQRSSTSGAAEREERREETVSQSSGETESLEDGDEFDAFPTESGTGTAFREGQVGGASYGEVAFDGGGGGDLALDEEPERGEAPRGLSAATAPVERADSVRPGSRALPAEKRRMSRVTKAGLVGALALTLAGGALVLVPDVGPYGAYVVIDTLKSDEYAALLLTVQKEARQAWQSDTAKGADRAFALAEASLQEAPRHGPLRAYAAYLGFMRQVRFGRDAASFARAKVLLESLDEAKEGEVAHLALARRARDAANGKLDGAKNLRGADPDAATLAGEAALLGGDGQAALEAWTRAAKVEDSARTAFGLARAHLALGQGDQALGQAERVIEKNAEHVGARLLIARLRLQERSREASLVTDLEAVTASEQASRSERVEALNLLGGLHLARSRMTKAEQSFSEALKLQADSLEALRGLGDALLAGGRFSEALARYEAATKVSADDLPSQLGVVRSQLAIERVEDAVTLLEALRQKHEKSTAVAYWFGRAKELVGDREAARTSYRSAVERNEDGSELVSAYVGLTRLLAQDGLAEEASEEIEKALQRFPDRAEVHVAVGDLATSQASYERAIAEYDKALELDPDDIGIHFKRGVALRRARSFVAAQQEFEAVAKIDPDFPGLALERGLLFEASGRSDEALAAYEGALNKAPEDVDLMLRVGCGKANAGQTDAAVQLLRTVLKDRPNSAETNHCLGRALLLGGGDLREAMRHLERAVVLDGNRAEHHLYVGWAANEARDPVRAEQALSRALELDQTLADAYWQRGVLRNRQGAVRDALRDLHRALEMNSTRYEAHASLAEAYFNLGREQEALNHWRLAVTSGPAVPLWRYRYGKLLFDNRQLPAAREQLELAIDAIEEAGDKPLWRWEAHRLLALCIGRHPDAIAHWQAYLVNSTSNSPYRAEALRELKALQR